MADKENQPTCTTTKPNRLQLTRNVGLKPTDTNKPQEPEQQTEVEYQLQPETDLGAQVTQIFDLTNMGPGTESMVNQVTPEMIKMLEHNDYVATTSITNQSSPPKSKKRQSDDSSKAASPQKRQKTSFFEAISKAAIDHIDEIDCITTSNQAANKWITINFK